MKWEENIELGIYLKAEGDWRIRVTTDSHGFHVDACPPPGRERLSGTRVMNKEILQEVIDKLRVRIKEEETKLRDNIEALMGLTGQLK